MRTLQSPKSPKVLPLQKSATLHGLQVLDVPDVSADRAFAKALDESLVRLAAEDPDVAFEACLTAVSSNGTGLNRERCEEFVAHFAWSASSLLPERQGEFVPNGLCPFYSQHKQESHGWLTRPSSAFCST